MPRYDDIDPQDINPETNAPYAGYSSPALDTSFHDHEMDVDDAPEDQVRELLKQWKCSCTDGFYLQRSRTDPRRHGNIGEWLTCTRCNGTGLDPRAAQALALLPTAEDEDEEASDRDFFDSSEDEDACTSPRGHKWAYTGTQYGGDDERWQGEGRCYCVHCGADGDG